jgi:hypothetical protein
MKGIRFFFRTVFPSIIRSSKPRIEQLFDSTNTTLATDNTVIPIETLLFVSAILFFVVVLEKIGEAEMDRS